MLATLPLLEKNRFPSLRRGKLETVQVNLGYRCNQQCLHCHVNAGPRRTEIMELETVQQILRFLQVSSSIKILDITGGAPELNPHFRKLVHAARAHGVHVIDRCNLTVLAEPGQENLADFLASEKVEITASLPCYLKNNVDRQRGKGVFDTSMHALQTLNSLGYGRPATGLVLNLVYNPQGPTLPPAQAPLEAAYKQRLQDEFGVTFNRLFTLANMPIQRFGSTLISKGQFDEYMALLRGAHQDSNLDAVMCRSLISIDWQGYVYDCDFNQMLGLPLRIDGRPRSHIEDLLGAEFSDNSIVVKDHCYGCTAGQGSSCGGALS